jgi:GDP/UDP-N,N'-diacetylbacillosamine 2-epimerase (hydrolysing)
LLNALESFPEIGLIFTMPNADTGGRWITDLIEKYVESHSNAVSFKSLGAKRYLSVMACVSGVIGNSSSGLLEAPSLGVGTVNVGDRQRGRIQAESVISCEPTLFAIQSAITELLSMEFRGKVQKAISPFGTGGASNAIVEIIKTLPQENLLIKKFHDYRN